MKNIHFSRILLVALFMTLMGNAFAQKQSNNLFLIVNDEGNLYGFINNKGKVVINPQFLEVKEFTENLAAARDTITFQYGFINTTGKMVIPAKYSEVTKFSEGLALVNDGDKWLIIDKNGKTIAKCDDMLSDYEYITIHEFHDGMALFIADGKYGYINKQGKVSIRPSFDYAEDFKNGIALTNVMTENENSTTYRIGYIDKTGSYVWSVKQTVENYNYDFEDYDEIEIQDEVESPVDDVIEIEIDD